MWAGSNLAGAATIATASPGMRVTLCFRTVQPKMAGQRPAAASRDQAEIERIADMAEATEMLDVMRVIKKQKKRPLRHLLYHDLKLHPAYAAG